MLLSTLGTSFSGNMLADKGTVRALSGNKGQRIVRVGYGSKNL